jgi:hypothetical protein
MYACLQPPHQAAKQQGDARGTIRNNYRRKGNKITNAKKTPKNLVSVSLSGRDRSLTLTNAEKANDPLPRAAGPRQKLPRNANGVFTCSGQKAKSK